LKHFALSADEILSGIVDGEHDSGIDGMYLFANGICVQDDTPLAALGRSTRLDLFLLQVKDAPGFGEDAINRLIASLPRILSFARNEADLARTVNPRVIEISRRFLNAYRDLDMAELRVFVVFASLKATQVHPNTQLKANQLQDTLRSLFGGADVQVVFLDATAVCELSRESPETTRALELAENPISTDTAGGFVAVVKLRDYQKFITRSTGELDASLFEANVRDYEGATSVNASIRDTLSAADDAVDFWWLNNGVTIVATEVQQAGKLLKLVSPQIVNGLQTSHEIYQRPSLPSGVTDNRSVLIKVVEARDPAVRERIIRATNSQTAFGPSALKATDKVQRQIEEYLAGRGLSYERRRRFYLNQGVPLRQIVSIDQMGQAVLSVMAQTPEVARARITQIYENDVYQLVFRIEYPLAVYSASIELFRRCLAFLERSDVRTVAEDFVCQLAMLAGIVLARKDRPAVKDIAGLEGVESDELLLDHLLRLIQEEYASRARGTRALLLDQLAKDRATTEAIMERGRAYLRRTARTDRSA